MPCWSWDGGPHGRAVRRETPLRHAVKNNCGTFSQCNPVFPGKGLWEGDRFLNNYATLLRRSQGSRVPAAPAEQGPLSLCLLQQGPVQAAGETSRAAQWSLSCINYLKYQTAGKRAVDLFVWLWWSERFLAKLRDVQIVRRSLFTPRGCVRAAGSFVVWMTYLYHNSSPRKFNSMPHNTARQ